jgi:acetyl-CoA carboxylase biotin carboxyl carrier protein
MINVEKHTARPSALESGDTSAIVAALAEEARQLAGGIDGRLRRVVLGLGDAQVEIEWATAESPVSSKVPASGPDRDPPPAGTTCVTAPAVGVFHAAAEPDAPPLVTPGQLVDPESPVGLIETMRVKNPVLAGVHGTVSRLLVEHGRSVEYGQPLVEVEPATGTNRAA